MTNDRPASKEKSGSATQKSILATLFQSAFSFAAVVYAIGFLIVNYSYSRYGFTADSISQARYISTGLLFVLIYSSLFILHIGSISILAKFYRFGFSLLIAAVLAVFAYSWSVNMTSFFLVFVSTPPFLFALEWLWSHSSDRSESHVQWQVGRTFLPFSSTLALIIKIMIVLIVASVVIYVWANYLWTYISPAIGGGNPNKGVVLFDQEAVKPLRITGLVIDQDGMTAPSLILYENSDEIVLLVDAYSDRERAIRIPRDLIVSITYIPREFDAMSPGFLWTTPTVSNLSATGTPTNTGGLTPSPDNMPAIITPNAIISTPQNATSTPLQP